MPRHLRIEYPGAVYHVLARGNNRQDIFKTDQDRERFLATLGEVCVQTGWIIHAYVLMRNHYHCLIETPEANLVNGMKWFQGTYTQRFNTVNHRSGHLYQGRYKALIIDPDEDDYFNTVSTYIHLNPFRARLVGIGTPHPLESFYWSSYPCYLVTKRSRPPWLETLRVLDSLGIYGQSLENRQRYRNFMEDRMLYERDPRKARENKEEYKAIRRGWAMGGDEFRSWLLDKIDARIGMSSDNMRGTQRKEHGIQAAEKLLTKALSELNLEEAELLSLKSVRAEKQAIAWLLKKHTVVTGVWLADRLNMGHRMNVTRAVNRINQSSEREIKYLRKKMLQCA